MTDSTAPAPNTSARQPGRPKRRLAALVLSLLLVLLAALAAVPMLRNMEEGPLDASARRQAPGQFIGLSHGIVHLRIAGPADGRPVLLVHGFSVPDYVYDQLAAELAAKGFRAIRFDLYGRGWSDRPDLRYDRQLFADQVLELMDALHLPKADLVGLSMGGAIVGRFAANHPERVRSLVLVDPLTRARDIGTLAWPLVGEWRLRVDYLPQLAESQLGDFVHPERAPGWAERFRPQMRYEGFGRAILSTLRNLSTASSLPDFEQVGKSKLPTLLVWGELDRAVPFVQNLEVRRAIPQARLLAVPGTGHLPVVEEAATTNPQIAAFLREH